MPKRTKPDSQQRGKESSPDPEKNDSSKFDRAPRQRNQDRDPVKSAEQTKHIPTQHGAIK
jgi:hypothetical protein